MEKIIMNNVCGGYSVSFIVNGHKLPLDIDWRLQRSGLDKPEHQELIPQKDGSLKQVMRYGDGTLVETVLSADGKDIITNVNREVVFNAEEGLVIILNTGDKVERGEDGSQKVTPESSN